MRLQRMLGHLTHLIPKTPTNALVIGCGAGVTAGAVSIGPRVKTMTIAEIEPLVPEIGRRATSGSTTTPWSATKPARRRSPR